MQKWNHIKSKSWYFWKPLLILISNSIGAPEYIPFSHLPSCYKLIAEVNEAKNGADIYYSSKSDPTKPVILFKVNNDGNVIDKIYPIVNKNIAKIYDIFVSKMDGDSLSDIVIQYKNKADGLSYLSIIFNEGGGDFSKTVSTTRFGKHFSLDDLGSDPNEYIEDIIDINGDGLSEIIVNRSASDGFVRYVFSLNDSNQYSQKYKASYFGLPDTLHSNSNTLGENINSDDRIIFKNFNSDKFVDAIVHEESDSTYLFINNSGKFEKSKFLSAGSFYDGDFQDYDGDGNVDFINLMRQGNIAELSWFKNLGSGGFSEKRIISGLQVNTGSSAFFKRKITTFDYNNDNKLDIMVSEDTVLSMFENEGSGFFKPAKHIYNAKYGIGNPSLFLTQSGDPKFATPAHDGFVISAFVQDMKTNNSIYPIIGRVQFNGSNGYWPISNSLIKLDENGGYGFLAEMKINATQKALYWISDTTKTGVFNSGRLLVDEYLQSNSNVSVQQPVSGGEAFIFGVEFGASQLTGWARKNLKSKTNLLDTILNIGENGQDVINTRCQFHFAQIDDDEILDLLVNDPSRGRLFFFQGMEDGQLSSNPIMIDSINIRNVAPAFVNGETILLVQKYEAVGQPIDLSVLRRDSTGIYKESKIESGIPNLKFMDFKDLDGDDVRDIVYSGNGLFWYKVDSQFNRSSKRTIANVSEIIRIVSLGDYDGDKNIDLIYETEDASISSINLIKGAGGGFFSTPVMLNARLNEFISDPSTTLSMVDIEGNGNMEIYSFTKSGIIFSVEELAEVSLNSSSIFNNPRDNASKRAPNSFEKIIGHKYFKVKNKLINVLGKTIHNIN